MISENERYQSISYYYYNILYCYYSNESVTEEMDKYHVMSK